MDKKKAGNGKMEVVFILDRSGSMCGLEADTIGGFNSMLQKQKKESDNVIWSTVLFDDEHEVIHNRVPIGKVHPMKEDDYFVRGCTALLDAIGRAVHHIAMCHKYSHAEDVPEKTLFIITTDGMENASREYTYRKVREMIKFEQEQYGWEFMFLGANIDAISVASRMGIKASRTSCFINDSKGISMNYDSFSRVMARMSHMKGFDEADLEDVREDYRKRSRKVRRP